MSEKIVKEVITLKEDPLEEFFNIPSGSTEVVEIKYETTNLVKIEDYDEKDDEIEKDLQEVIDKAMSGYENLQEAAEDMDSKYVARTQEVANQLLSTALAAVKEKANLKINKDKNNIAKNKATTQKTVNNNILITDTNSLIRQLKQMEPTNTPIDVTPIDKEENINESKE